MQRGADGQDSQLGIQRVACEEGRGTCMKTALQTTLVHTPFSVFLNRLFFEQF